MSATEQPSRTTSSQTGDPPVVPSRGVTGHFDLSGVPGAHCGVCKDTAFTPCRSLRCDWTQVPRTLGQRPQDSFHPVLPESSEDPDTVAPPRGSSLLPHGLFLSEIASSRTFPWLCASIPTLGAASLFLFHSGSSGHVLAARWWPLGKASMANGLVDSPFPPPVCPSNLHGAGSTGGTCHRVHSPRARVGRQ